MTHKFHFSSSSDALRSSAGAWLKISRQSVSLGNWNWAIGAGALARRCGGKKKAFFFLGYKLSLTFGKPSGRAGRLNCSADLYKRIHLLSHFVSAIDWDVLLVIEAHDFPLGITIVERYCRIEI
ncbi:hypothetical protein chiPu_0016922 [Chiloscyllium punctatum]|uniref:Uncharacterized protein n=1 Tax=Chiloscyllium punctatum TaxID=137246 RepID=A0A401T6Y6_CHIPU|nr:hypothetical protein [Chiloscyllium punctatum]